MTRKLSYLFFTTILFLMLSIAGYSRSYAAVNFISPAGNSTLTGGQTYSIVWQGGSWQPIYVHVDLFRFDGNLVKTDVISPGFHNASSFGTSWIVQTDIPTNQLYKLVIRDDRYSPGHPQGNLGESGLFTINQPPPPTPAPTVSLSANPATVEKGQSATLTWSSTNATKMVSSNFGATSISGSTTVAPTTTATYTIKVEGGGGQKEASIQVTVTEPKTHYESLGYYISPAIGEENLVSFDTLKLINQNLSPGGQISYQFASSTDNYASWTEPVVATTNKGILCGLMKCGDSPTVNLKNFANLQKGKYLKIRINLSTKDDTLTPSLGGFEVYYTTQGQPSVSTITKKLKFIFDLQGRKTNKLVKAKIKITKTQTENYQSLFTSTLTTNQEGTIEQEITAPNLCEVLIFVKAENYLSRDYSACFNKDKEIRFGEFLAGDFNNDDYINSLDFSLLNKSWGKSNAVIDINEDTIINSLDFSILNKNWGKQGEALGVGVGL